jgi:membrane associated rhomboid family serine protease
MFPIKTTVPTRYPAGVTWSLIAINLAIFFIQLGLTPRELEWFLFRFGLIPARYFAPFAPSSAHDDLLDYLPFITNVFVHAGWLHLIINMWTLWLFGPAVEDRLGPMRYLVFYLVCGFFASFAHALLNPLSTIPTVGASGAVAGVLGCFIRLFPLARIIVLIPILFLPFFFEMPALIYVGFWYLMQVLQGTAELFRPAAGGGVAWWAHIGGFLAGLLLGPLLARSERRYRPYYPDEGILGFDPTGRR